jgi:hypothetical protein
VVVGSQGGGGGVERSGGVAATTKSTKRKGSSVLLMNQCSMIAALPGLACTAQNTWYQVTQREVTKICHPNPDMLKYEGQNWPGLAKFQPATEIDQLQLTFFVLKIESGYIFLWNMIGIHT